jgi:photosystem II stability/assembly factor-like uncharacterized protein
MRLVTLLLLLLPLAASAQMTYQTLEPGMTPKKREIFFYGMRAYPFGKIPQNARLEALYQAETKMKKFGGDRGILSANQWTSIGPFSIGGRINTLVAHPTDGKTLWAGAADGGVWKTTDRGSHWTAVMDNENAITMGALAIDPQKPDVIYAGTGEMTSNIDGYTGAGIFKSVDGGATWRGLGLTNIGAFCRILVHPQNSNLIFAGATKNNGGFYRSTDGGQTWTRTLDQQIADVTLNPSNQGEVWASTMSKGIYRSTDGGLTFKICSNDITGFTGFSTVQRISVQAAPSSPNILYALTFETDGSGDGQTNHSRIYKSTNSGVNWTNVYNDDPSDFLNTSHFGADNTQGWYNNVLAVSPTDPNVVVAGGVGIVRTTNGGTSWYYINTYAVGPHPDQHALAFDPSSPSRVYIGNDGGVALSEDKGGTWQHVNNGLAITQFYGMGVHQGKPTPVAYGGTQDNGTVDNGSSAYKGGDGAYVAVDPNGNYLYAENYSGGNLERIDLESGQRESIMDGIGFNAAGTNYEDAAWAAPIAIDPVNPNTIWHARKSIYGSLTQGSPWLQTTGSFTGLGSAIAVSPANDGIIYAGSDRGEVLVSLDGGDTWLNRSRAQGLPNRAVTDFAPSQTDPGTAYMAVSGFYTNHVFKTTDNGESWTSISASLPDIPVNALAIHPDDEKIIYAGTDIGMFITTDGGATWASYNQGLPRVVVADLEVHRSSKTLVMASHGRSMWEIPLEKPSLPPSITSPAGGEVWMAGTYHTVSWSGFSGSTFKIDYSLDDGATWNELARDVSGSSFLWNIFDTTASYARVRVSAIGGSGESATSRSFTITKFSLGGLLTTNGVPSGIPYGLAYDGEFLWATDFASNNLLKLDATTLQTLGSMKMNLTGGDSLFTDIAYVPEKGHFFIHKILNTVDASPGGYLYEVDKQGNQIGRWTSPCTYPIGLAWLGGPNSSRQQLIATDRNGSEYVYFIDPNDPGSFVEKKNRVRNVRYGPRGATQGPDGKTFYQAITDFTGETLQSTTAEKMNIETQGIACSFPLSSPFISTGAINARGIEFDPRDSTLWVSDYSGNIYKIVSCDSRISAPPPPESSVPGEAIPAGMSLAQNTPNPFTGPTSISFSIPKAGAVKLAVYDMTGRLVATLADGRYEAGEHRAEFIPENLPSGVYTCSLTIEGGATLTRRMIHLH